MAFKKILNKLDVDALDLLKGGGTTFFIRIFGIILLYIFTLIITNLFGAEIYGEFSFFVLSLKILSLIAMAGIDIYLLRYISDDPKQIKISDYIGKGTVAVFVNSIILAALVYLLISNSYQIFFSDYYYIILLLACLFPFTLLRMNAQSYRALKNTAMFSILEYVGIPLVSILAFFALKFGFGLTDFTPANAYLLAIMVIFIVSLFHWQFKFGNDLLSKFWSHLKEVPKTNKMAIPFLIAGSSMFFGPWIVALILKYFAGNESLGNFEAAMRIGYLLMMPLVAATTIAAPIFSRKYGKGELEGIKKVLKLTTNVIFLITFPILLLIFVFSDPLMALYGNDFAQSGNVLRVLLIGFFFNSLTGPISLMLQMCEKQILVQNVFVASTFINILFSFILIPKYGIMGAAWSNVIYQILINGILLIYLKRKFGYLSFGR